MVSYNWVRTMSQVFGVLMGILSYILVIYMIYLSRAWRPGCPETPAGGVCNGRGVCLPEGRCECDILYSGEVCTETQVPGYLDLTNQECGSHGIGYPFGNFPDFCLGDWNSVECESYVRETWILIEDNGVEAVGDRIFTIPQCWCIPPRAGRYCQYSGCPRDENNYVCAQHGNRSVALFQNGTEGIGEGCQCRDLVGLSTPSLLDEFTPDDRRTLFSEYNNLFTQRFCGTLYQQEVPGDSSLLWLETQLDNYACYCTDDWKGLACTEGKCPGHPVTDEICFGNGHRRLGIGLETNTTREVKADGTLCEPECINGFSQCRLNEQQCVFDQSSPLYFQPSTWCYTTELCPNTRPIRCGNGQCVKQPLQEQGKCENDFEEGVRNLNNSIVDFRCRDNMTEPRHITECFQNVTEIPAILAIADGGLIVDVGETFTVDLGSQLVYFQFLVDQEIQVTTWDDQRLVFDTDTEEEALFSGVFTYPRVPSRVLSEESVTITPIPFAEDPNLDFAITPMSWNYSGLVLYDPNYASVEIREAGTGGILYSLSARSSDITLVPYTNETFYTLVRFQPGTETNQTEQWLWPETGLSVSRATCLSDPARCAWHIDENDGQIRSLDSAWYVCNGTESKPVVSSTPCDNPDSVLPYMFSWITSQLAESSSVW